MLPWIILGVLLAVLTTAITLIWWWVGDQWADDEYKKFGHGGGAKPSVEQPSVIRDSETTDSAQSRVIESTTHES